MKAGEHKPRPRSNEADGHIARRIRERRVMRGLSQQDLAKLIGVTCQQAQKYERAINRVSAGRLVDIAQALDTPVSYFFIDLPGAEHDELSPRRRQMLDLMRVYSALPGKQQDAVMAMVRAMADVTPDQGAA